MSDSRASVDRFWRRANGRRSICLIWFCSSSDYWASASGDTTLPWRINNNLSSTWRCVAITSSQSPIPYSYSESVVRVPSCESRDLLRARQVDCSLDRRARCGKTTSRTRSHAQMHKCHQNVSCQIGSLSNFLPASEGITMESSTRVPVMSGTLHPTRNRSRSDD